MTQSKSILANTFYLYIRMFLVMILTLYTTRIVLSELGLSDYGIYDVIAGVVASLSFINQSLASANQRFLAFAIGEGREDDLKEVYRVSITIFVVLGLLILILGETVGIWFVKTKLSIPIERQSAAILLYHFSLFSFLFSFVTIPFIAEIIAHEEMKIFAVIGIVVAGMLLLFGIKSVIEGVTGSSEEVKLKLMSLTEGLLSMNPWIAGMIVGGILMVGAYISYRISLKVILNREY